MRHQPSVKCVLWRVAGVVWCFFIVVGIIPCVLFLIWYDLSWSHENGAKAYIPKQYCASISGFSCCGDSPMEMDLVEGRVRIRSSANAQGIVSTPRICRWVWVSRGLDTKVFQNWDALTVSTGT